MTLPQQEDPMQRGVPETAQAASEPLDLEGIAREWWLKSCGTFPEWQDGMFKLLSAFGAHLLGLRGGNEPRGTVRGGQ